MWSFSEKEYLVGHLIPPASFGLSVFALGNAPNKGLQPCWCRKRGKKWTLDGPPPFLSCRRSCGLCGGYLGNSVDVKLQEMRGQAAGDAIDFFGGEGGHCVMPGHFLNPSAPVSSCPRRRSSEAVPQSPEKHSRQCLPVFRQISGDPLAG